jgi:hypothetical protein
MKPLARHLSFNTTSSIESPLIGLNRQSSDTGLNFFKGLLDAASKKQTVDITGGKNKMQDLCKSMSI